MGKRADKLLENLLKAHDQGALAELTKKMAGGFPPLIERASPIVNHLPAITTSTDGTALLSSPLPSLTVPETSLEINIEAYEPVKESDKSLLLDPDLEPDHAPDFHPEICPDDARAHSGSVDECTGHQPTIEPVIESVYRPEIVLVDELVLDMIGLAADAVDPVLGPVFDLENEPAPYPVLDEVIATELGSIAIDAIIECPYSKPDKQPAKYMFNASTNEPTFEPDNGKVKCVDPELWYPFTEKQGKVLFYLIDAGGLANRQHISDDTGVNIATVKHTLRILVKEGYIGQIRLYVNHTQRGFSYKVNPQLCNEYYERLKGWINYSPVRYPVYRAAKNPNRELIHNPDNWPDNWPVSDPVKVPADSPVAIVGNRLSGRSEPQATVDQTLATELHILTTPEMAYWLDLGLQDSQVRTWCADFEVTPTEIRQQLAWARWDLVVNGREAEIEKDAISWFTGILRKTAGCYPPAKGYLTPIEIRANWSRAQLAAEDKARTDLSEMERLTEREG